MSLDLYISTKNPVRSALVKSLTSNAPAPMLEFTLGDTIPTVNIYLIDGDGGYDAASGTAGYTPRLGIGATGGIPTGGTFTLTFGANTTSALSYAISAADLSTALNALASVVTAGGVTVSGSSPRWVVTFVALGSMAAFTASGTSLTPSSGVSISTLTEGSGSAYEVQLIRLAKNPAVFQDSWGLITNGWAGTLSLATRELLDLLGTSASLSTTLEFELTDSGGYRRTYCQVPVIIYNELIDLNPSATVASGEVALSTTAALDSYVQNRTLITGLTGGTSTKLDSIVTLSKGPLWLVAVAHSSSGVEMIYRLESGTTAEAAPWTIRPDDYATTTNEKVWNLKLASKNGNALLWNPSDSKFYEHGCMTLNGQVVHSIGDTGISITS